jgi:hypothetical protein
MNLKGGKKIVVEDLDATGIFLYDRSYSHDWHLPNAFRHEIAIPDDVMPSIWENGPWHPGLSLKIDSAYNDEEDEDDDLTEDA